MGLNLRDLVSRLRIVTDKKAGSTAEKDVQTSFQRMEGFAKKVGAAIAAAFVLHKIKDFAVAAIKEAAEAEKAWARLASVVTGAGVKFTTVEGQLRGLAQAFADATVHGDDDFAVVLQRLIALSGDYSASLANVGLVANVAAKYFDGELAPAADLVGRALAGNVRGLKQLGIQTKDAAEGLRLLAEGSMGEAEARAKTFAGQVQDLNNEWGEFKEAIGNALIAAGGGTSILETLTATLKTMAAWVDTNRAAIAEFGHVVTTVGITAVKGFKFALEELADAGAFIVLVPMTALTKAAALAASAYALAAQAAAAFAGLISGSAKTAIEQHAARIRALASDLHDAADAQFRALTSADPRKHWSRPGAAPKPASTPAGTGIMPGGGIGLPAEEVDSATAAMVKAAEAADKAKASWEVAIESMIDGFESAGQAANGYAAGVASALIGGLATYANAEAMKEAAAGVGKLAAGTWPPNPAALASAGIHFASAAAWKLLAGFAGSGASRVAGSGGRGGVPAPAGSSRSVGDNFANNARQPQTIIYIDGFSPGNPVHVRTLAAGIKAAGKSDSSVEVRPRGGR